MSIPVPQFNPQARPSLIQTGDERSPVLIIDDVLTNADAIRSYAITCPFGPPTATVYPGLNAFLPPALIEGLMMPLRTPLQQIFGVPSQAGLAVNGYFGLVCADPATLVDRQCLPHVDTTQPSLAVLFYLCDGSYGGTGFYRHGTTGFETVTAGRLPVYEVAVQRELNDGPPVAAYPTETINGFELIGKAEAQFNRMLIYHGNLLHSGLVNVERLSADPATGRLTLNLFVTPQR